jgi:hypothetical protein
LSSLLRYDFIYPLLKCPLEKHIVITIEREGASFMEPGDWHILAIVGGIFIVLGIGAILWGYREEKKLFEELAAKPDLREFSLKHIETPQPGALKIGGWIAVVLGVVVLVLSILMWRYGWPPI